VHKYCCFHTELLIIFYFVFRPAELKRKRRHRQGGENIAQNEKAKKLDAIFSPDPLTARRFRFGRSCRKTIFKKEKEYTL
jgi:hypothetical protein